VRSSLVRGSLGRLTPALRFSAVDMTKDLLSAELVTMRQVA
jgi:hypothetical protein